MTTLFKQNLDLLKYPRTAHIEGSRLQKGDEDYGHTPYKKLVGRYLVIEEKLDGGNCGVSYSSGAEQLLQSRGHYLTGGSRERQFNLFKRWASAHESVLLDCLGDQYICYGEWLHKKHSVFYDKLPAYFNEFDIWDRSTECFLSTAARKAITGTAPVLAVPVLYQGVAPAKLKDLLAMVVHSYAKTPAWRDTFESVVKREGFDLAKAWSQADKSDLMEGLYIKVEEEGKVVERYKLVRSDFVQSILDANVHHSEQPFVPNQLAAGADIFAPELSMTWEDLGLVTKEGL